MKAKTWTMQQLIDYYGSISALARTLGISHSAVIQWAGLVPVNRAYQIEVVTKGKFKAANAPVKA